MALDPLADRLEALLAEGSIVGSELTPSMRERLATLFRVDVLTERKAGGGMRVVLKDRAALDAWISRNYPSGLSGTSTPLPNRAASVANFADSKRGRSAVARPVYLRGFGDAVLRSRRASLPLGAMTRTFKLTGVLVDLDILVDAADPCAVDGTIALVENLELFLHVERVVPQVDVALYAAGRLDQRLLQWIGAMPAVRVLHVGDFDPVGLDEYRRVRAVLGERATLFVPERLAEYVRRFGKPELLVKSSAVLERVRRDPDPMIQAVLAILDVAGKGMEQEALLVELGPARLPK
ncbi:MAG: hypothetical protein JNL90_10735 [Planctomycetes bacterium]|nr:hypothetical protein [Planctomycetota bacterium]